jgi:hypothetical protein
MAKRALAVGTLIILAVAIAATSIHVRTTDATDNPLQSDVWQLREFKGWSAYNPEFSFLSSANNSWLSVSSSGGSIGRGYARAQASRSASRVSLTAV